MFSPKRQHVNCTGIGLYKYWARIKNHPIHELNNNRKKFDESHVSQISEKKQRRKEKGKKERTAHHALVNLVFLLFLVVARGAGRLINALDRSLTTAVQRQFAVDPRDFFLLWLLDHVVVERLVLVSAVLCSLRQICHEVKAPYGGRRFRQFLLRLLHLHGRVILTLLRRRWHGHSFCRQILLRVHALRRHSQFHPFDTKISKRKVMLHEIQYICKKFKGKGHGEDEEKWVHSEIFFLFFSSGLSP